MRDSLCLVTGTSSGVGRAVASMLCERGWDVIGVARRQVEIGGSRYRHLVLDLGDLDAVQQQFGEQFALEVQFAQRRRFGLVNNAAMAQLLGAVEDLSMATLERAYAVNTVAPTFLMAYFLRTCPREVPLRIVNVSSGAAVKPYPGLGVYGGNKAALRMTAMVVAAESDRDSSPNESSRDLAVVNYAPGPVDTPMQEYARSLSPEKFPWGQMFHDFVERGALVPPEAPAKEIVTLLEAASLPRFSERALGT